MRIHKNFDPIVPTKVELVVEYLSTTLKCHRHVGRFSLGVPGVPQILADQLTLFQPRGADYAHQIVLAPPDFQTFRRL